ncbi:flagellar biosynthesis protein FlhG [Bacillus ectoiniformans]|uniref:MinD/ParA family protein n=1 Tax=Bacillus ectoiniformans TaxID=1494429 RepID=UPI001956C9FD|nr:flagellar biosynthesis protein FlhG [Bacillus ectoiniformans]
MSDQAEELRQKLLRAHHKPAQTIAVVSGKGGVGKSNISMNFAIQLSNYGKKVLILDMDIGMGNIHLLTGQSAEYSIIDFFENNVELEDLVVEGPGGISCILGGTSLGRLMEWGENHLERWLSAFEKLQYQYDYLLFDMGAGATKESLDIIMSVEDVIVVTTPEPTAITDAYSMMKYIHLRDEQKSFHLICNRAEKPSEGTETLRRLKHVMNQFMNKEVVELGILPEDKTVRKAVSAQQPFLLSYPNAVISQSMRGLVSKYVNSPVDAEHSFEKIGFVKKLRYFLFERQR